ncbi:MAG: hypothetical protein AAGA56_13015 [Myxococcota bacterium]
MKRSATLALMVLASTVLAGPTPGDIGGCGQEAELLDPVTFFAVKQITDCQRCTDCQIANETCSRACDDEFDAETATLDPDCVPLAHDGEVCLRAIDAASCGDFESFVDDVAPTVPTECNFCPPDRRDEAGQ